MIRCNYECVPFVLVIFRLWFLDMTYRRLWFLDMTYRRLWFLDMTYRVFGSSIWLIAVFGSSIWLIAVFGSSIWLTTVFSSSIWLTNVFLPWIARRKTIMEQKLYTRPANLSSPPLLVSSCCSIFGFLWSVSWTIVCLFIVFLLAIVFLLRSHTDSEYYFGIFKISRWNPQISKGSELSLYEVLGYLQWRKKRRHTIFVNLQKKWNYITWIFKHV